MCTLFAYADTHLFETPSCCLCRSGLQIRAGIVADWMCCCRLEHKYAMLQTAQKQRHSYHSRHWHLGDKRFPNAQGRMLSALVVYALAKLLFLPEASDHLEACRVVLGVNVQAAGHFGLCAAACCWKLSHLDGGLQCSILSSSHRWR